MLERAPALTTHPGDRDEIAAEQVLRAGPGAPGARSFAPRAPAQAPSRESRRAALPSSVAAVVARPGKPLAPEMRRSFEDRFDVGLDAVRLHDGADAEAATRELRASAFAFGPHIVLRKGWEDARTAGGDSLLAHELGHVISPPAEALIGLQPATTGGPPVPAPADADAVLRRWLGQHQLAPPEQQPSEGERHVLLNGEDMPISKAAGLAGAAVGQPVEKVQAVIAQVVSRTVPASALGAPVLGPGNELPGLHLGPGIGLGNVAVGKMLDLQHIDEWLDAHGFRLPDVRDPTGASAYLDGQPTTVEQVADRALALYRDTAIGGVNMSFLTRQEVLDHLRQRYVSMRGGPQTQMVFGYTLIPRALQAVTGTQDPLNPLRNQHQFSFTITRQHHAGDSPGLESSFQGSVTIDDSGNVMNLQAGGQEAIVKPLLQGWIQVSGLVQTMAITNFNKTATGSVSLAPVLQQSAGGQVLFTPVPHSGPFQFLSGHVQLGAQVLGQVNVPLSGGPVTTGVQAGFVLNIPF